MDTSPPPDEIRQLRQAIHAAVDRLPADAELLAAVLRLLRLPPRPSDDPGQDGQRRARRLQDE